jgi:putative transposase
MQKSEQDQHWLTAEQVAVLEKSSIRTVQRNVASGKYAEVKYESSTSGGGKDGKLILINLSSLPTSAQVAYLREIGHIQEAAALDDGWDQQPQWRRDIAVERLQILTACDHYVTTHPEGKRTELIKEFLHSWTIVSPENKNCSVQTLYRWRKAYQDGGRMALIPDWGNAGRKEIINPKAWTYFDRIYGTLNKRTSADCYRELKTVAVAQGWQVPSLRTVQRKIKQYPDAYWLFRREGKREFEEKCLPYMHRDLEALHGGEVWVGDGHNLDFFIKGPHGTPVRPVLSGWVDMRSAKWLGWCIDYTNNTDTVMAAFARAALNPDVGIPYQMYIDNGRENDNIRFAYGGGHRKKTKDTEKYNEARIHSLVYQLGIETIFAIPANGRAKIIERQFGEVARNFSKRFETYCGSDNKDRKEGLNDILKNPANLPDLQTVRALFDKWIELERNQQPSQGQGRKNETPDQTFAKTRLPVRLVPESVLRLCFLPHPRPLTVTRQGINLFDTWYYDEKLIEYLGKKVIVRYRNEDLTKVYIFTEKEEHICDAEMDGLVHPTQATKEDFEKHKAIRKKAKKRIEQRQDDLDNQEVMTFNEYLDEKARQSIPTATAEKTNVVAMVPVSKELLESAKVIQKLVVGGDNCLSYEQRKAQERERQRETMRAIKQSMSMSK